MKTLHFPKKGLVLDQLLGDNLRGLGISCLTVSLYTWALGHPRVYVNNVIYGEGLCLFAWGALGALKTKKLRTVTQVIHACVTDTQ